jgi:hypothetical protein
MPKLTSDQLKRMTDAAEIAAFFAKPRVGDDLIDINGKIARPVNAADTLTIDQLKRMTDAEIRAFWIEQQLARKRAGLPFDEVLYRNRSRSDMTIAVDLREVL